jgi:hypothetical protein
MMRLKSGLDNRLRKCPILKIIWYFTLIIGKDKKKLVYAFFGLTQRFPLYLGLVSAL